MPTSLIGRGGRGVARRVLALAAVAAVRAFSADGDLLPDSVQVHAGEISQVIIDSRHSRWSYAETNAHALGVVTQADVLAHADGDPVGRRRGISRCAAARLDRQPQSPATRQASG